MTIKISISKQVTSPMGLWHRAVHDDKFMTKPLVSPLAPSSHSHINFDEAQKSCWSSCTVTIKMQCTLSILEVLLSTQNTDKWDTTLLPFILWGWVEDQDSRSQWCRRDTCMQASPKRKESWPKRCTRKIKASQQIITDTDPYVHS